MKKELELKVLEMCEEILPKTTMKNNSKLKKLLEEIRNELESK